MWLKSMKELLFTSQGKNYETKITNKENNLNNSPVALYHYASICGLQHRKCRVYYK